MGGVCDSHSDPCQRPTTAGASLGGDADGASRWLVFTTPAQPASEAASAAETIEKGILTMTNPSYSFRARGGPGGFSARRGEGDELVQIRPGHLATIRLEL